MTAQAVVVRGTKIASRVIGKGTPGAKGDPGSPAEGYATRTAMAGRASPSLLDDVFLTESGREGKFIVDLASNWTAAIAADTAQGMFVPSTTDATKVYRRALGPDLWVNAEHFGMSTAGSSGAANVSAFNVAVAVAKAAGFTGLLVPPKVYPATGAFSTIGGRLTISMHGARFTGAGLLFKTDSTADVTVLGGHLEETGTSQSSNHFDVSGTVRFKGTRFTRTSIVSSPSYMGYFRATSTNCVLENCSSLWCNGVFLEGSGHDIGGNNFAGVGVGADDMFAIKGANTTSHTINIHDNNIFDYANGLAIGSEVGNGGADDATVQYGVHNVSYNNNKHYRCTSIALIKPGAISTIDYRNGLVELVHINDNSLYDPNGQSFMFGISIRADRGSTVRHITGRGNKVIARCAAATGSPVTAVLLIYFPNVGAQHGTITDVELECDYLDPFGAVANAAAIPSGYNGLASGAAAPGYPIQSFADAEQATVGSGTAARIALKGSWNGSKESGVNIGGGFDNAITIRRGTRIRNSCQNIAASARAGIYPASRVKIEDGVIVESVGSSKNAVGHTSLTTANLYNSAKSPLLPWQPGTIAAGTDVAAVAVFVAPVDLYLTDIDFVASAAVAQSDTDYVNLIFSVGATNFLTATTKVTGGVNIAANTATRMNPNTLTAAACYMAKGSVLTLQTTHGGAGKAISNGKVQLSFVPYGEL